MGSDQSTNNGNRRTNRREDRAYDNRNQRRQSSPSRPQTETPSIIIYERIRTPYSYSQNGLTKEEISRQLANKASTSQPHSVPRNPTPPPPNAPPVNPTPSPNPAPTQPHSATLNPPPSAPVKTNPSPSYPAPLNPNISHPNPAPVNPTPSPYPAPLKQTPSHPSPATLNPTPSASLNTNPPPSYPAPLYPNISHHHPAPGNTTPSPYPASFKQTPSQPYPVPLNPPPPRSMPPNHQPPAFPTATPASNHRDASPAPSSRRSASRDGRNSNDKYKCPSCSISYGSNIYQCPSGHSGCDECRNTATLCALCGLNFTDRRNYAMEDFLNPMKVACPNASDGCRLYLRSVDMETHVPECPFGIMDCPVNNAYGNCRWRGKPNEMVAHFDRFHPVERCGNVNTEYIIPDITRDSHNLYLVELSPYCFILHEKVDGDEGVYITVQLLGTAMSASKWNYEVHVYKKSEPRRKFTYTGPCLGIKSPVNDIFSRCDCAVLPFKYGKTLANDDRLRYKIFIKKQENDNPKNNFSGRGRRPPRNNANCQ